MFTIDLGDFMFELDDGTIKHVGAPTAGATAKLFHVSDAEARAFGDSQVKFAFADGEGNEVEVALDPEAAGAIADDVEAMRDEGPVFE